MPLGRIGGVRCRHGGGHFGIPTCESIAVSGYHGSGYFRTECGICRAGAAFAAVSVKGQFVGIDLPLSFYGKIICGESGRNLGFPTCESIAFFCRVGRSGYRITDIAGNRVNCVAAVSIKGDCGLRQCLPLGRIGGVRCRHGGGHFGIPTYESIAVSGYYGSGYCCAELGKCRAGAAFAAVSVKGKVVAVYLPLGNNIQVFCRESGRNIRIPTEESVAFFCRIGRRGYI